MNLQILWQIVLRKNMKFKNFITHKIFVNAQNFLTLFLRLQFFIDIFKVFDNFLNFRRFAPEFRLDDFLWTLMPQVNNSEGVRVTAHIYWLVSFSRRMTTILLLDDCSLQISAGYRHSTYPRIKNLIIISEKTYNCI